MIPSPACETFIKGFETCRLSAFKPTPNDVWTIGWGRTTGVWAGMTEDQAQADADFTAAMALFGRGVTQELDGAPTTQGQFNAMVSFAYNVGLDNDHDGIAEGLGDSTLLKLHKAGDYVGAANEFAKWNKQKGVVLNGLTRRRAAEAAMYRGDRDA